MKPDEQIKRFEIIEVPEQFAREHPELKGLVWDEWEDTLVLLPSELRTIGIHAQFDLAEVEAALLAVDGESWVSCFRAVVPAGRSRLAHTSGSSSIHGSSTDRVCCPGPRRGPSMPR